MFIGENLWLLLESGGCILRIDFKGCWVSQTILSGTWVPLSVEDMSEAICLDHVAAYDAGFR